MMIWDTPIRKPDTSTYCTPCFNTALFWNKLRVNLVTWLLCGQLKLQLEARDLLRFDHKVLEDLTRVALVAG